MNNSKVFRLKTTIAVTCLAVFSEPGRLIRSEQQAPLIRRRRANRRPSGSTWTGRRELLDEESIDSSMSLLYEDSQPSIQVEHSSLEGTSWTAVETNSFLPANKKYASITLNFESGYIFGDTGCNSYSGKINLLSANAFNTSDFATTRRWCSGLMKQERNFLNFLGNSVFFHEVFQNRQNNNSWKEDLFLYDSAPGPGGESVKGDMLAHFERSGNGEAEGSGEEIRK